MKFRFAKGDRIDFDNFYGIGQGTPGTVLNRVHTLGYPAYAIQWDDDNTDNPTYAESDLVALPGTDKEN